MRINQRPFWNKVYAISILELDDVSVKTIYCFLSSLEWGPEGSTFGGPVWGSTYCTVPALDLLKSLFNSTQEPSLNSRKNH